MMPFELVRQMEDDSNRLKKVVADLKLDKAMLQDVVRRTLESPPVGESLWMT